MTTTTTMYSTTTVRTTGPMIQSQPSSPDQQLSAFGVTMAGAAAHSTTTPTPTSHQQWQRLVLEARLSQCYRVMFEQVAGGTGATEGEATVCFSTSAQRDEAPSRPRLALLPDLPELKLDTEALPQSVMRSSGSSIYAELHPELTLALDILMMHYSQHSELRLTFQEQYVIIYILAYQRSRKEIAEGLGVSIRTVGTLYNKALDKFSTALAD